MAPQALKAELQGALAPLRGLRGLRGPDGVRQPLHAEGTGHHEQLFGPKLVQLRAKQAAPRPLTAHSWLSLFPAIESQQRSQLDRCAAAQIQRRQALQDLDAVGASQPLDAGLQLSYGQVYAVYASRLTTCLQCAAATAAAECFARCRHRAKKVWRRSPSPADGTCECPKKHGQSR